MDNNQNSQNSIFDVDFKDIAVLLLTKIWAPILAFAICFGYVYYAKELTKVPMYTASATMYVTNSNNTKYVYSSSDSYNSLALIETCSVVIKTDTVMDLVAEKLDGKYSQGYIKSCINVFSVNETEVMQITATTPDAQGSADICNAVIEVIPTILKERIKVGAANVLDEATVPTYCTNLPSFKTPIEIGLLGAVIVAAVIVIAYLLDTRIKSKDEIPARYGIPVLSDIPNFNIKPKERYNNYYERR